MTDTTSGLKQFGLQAQDAKWAGGLFLALVLVFVFDLLRAPKTAQTLPSPTITPVAPPEGEINSGTPLRMAVTKPHYDDMGTLLDTLGTGYKYEKWTMNDLLDKQKYEGLNILFATCSAAPNEWIEQSEVGGESRPGTVTSRAKPEVIDRIREHLRAFVGGGGTLYASDWQFSLLNFAFPEFIDFRRAIEGAEQTVDAEAVDESLRKVVGSRLQLKFDMRSWKPAAFHDDKVTVLLRGEYKGMDGETYDSPLLVKFPFEKGTVIFTSFHNEKQNSELEKQLLKFLVFTTVLANTEAKMKDTLVKGGFQQTGKSLLSVSSGSPSVTETYQSTKAGQLRFSLGFENRDAKMRLTVVGPDGKSHEKEGISPLVVDIPDAPVGSWKYTITALKTPFDNFPYALTIGHK